MLIIMAKEENLIQKKMDTRIKILASTIVTIFSFLNWTVIPEAKVQTVAIDRQAKLIIDGA